MVSFFHIIPICPFCLEPSGAEYPVIILKDKYRCSSPECGAEFKISHNLWDGKEYPKTVSYLYSHNNENQIIKEVASSLPWIWKILTSDIENAYLDWIRQDHAGIHLITWPDERVRFLPLLISEYLSSFPHRDITILFKEKSGREKKSDTFDFPSVKIRYENLLFTDNEWSFPTEIMSDLQKYNVDKYLLKRKKTEITIRKESGNIIFHNYEYGSSIKAIRNKTEAEIESSFGNDALKTVEEIIKNKSEITTINKSGDLHLIIKESDPGFAPGTNRFKPKELWNYVINYSDFIKPSNNISFFQLDNEFLKNPVTLLDLSGDLLIVEDADYLVQDKRYYGPIHQHFYNLLNSDNFKTVLLFSSFQEKRHIYNILHRDGFFKQLPVIYHTIDNREILHHLKSNQSEISLFSGFLSEKNDNNLSIIPEFTVITELSDIRKMYQELAEKSTIQTRLRLRYHESRIIRTLLNLKPKSLHEPYFSPLYRVSSENLSVETIFSRLTIEFGQNSDETNQYSSTIKRIFGNSLCENPIRKKIELIIDELLNQNYEISILVPYDDYFELSGFIKSGYWTFISENNVKISTWNIFNSNLKSNKKEAVISLVHPSLNYKYSSQNFDKIIFIGEFDYLKSIQDIISSRTDEKITRPLIKPSDINAVPKLLADIIQQIPDCLFNQPESDSCKLMEDQTHNSVNILDETLNGIKIFLSDGTTYVIPSGTPVIVRDDDWFDEIIAEASNLPGKSLIFNRNKLLQSFRRIFTEFMINNYHFPIISSSGKWDNFQVMYNESRAWNHLLESTISRYALENEIEFRKAEIIITNLLSSSGLTAESTDYIPNWWTRIDTIETKEGDEISVFRTERPKNIHDMRKIFGIIENKYPGLSGGVDPDRVYYASRNLQNMRTRFMKGEWSHGPENRIYQRIREEIQMILSVSESAIVIRVEMTSG